MMFSMLAISVCLAALFLLLSGTTLVSVPLLRIAVSRLRCPPSSAAGILFAIRILPVLLGFVLTAGLVLPAFLRFEPHSSGEAIGVKLLLLSAAGALALLAMLVRGIRILGATARTARLWREQSEEKLISAGDSIVRVNVVAGGPPALLAVTGFFRPRVFVSRQVAATLLPEELSAALAHELAHIRSFDNLKQWFLKTTRPPRWMGASSADNAWINVTEVAADEAALTTGASALDLASALLKMVTLKRQGSYPAEDELAASHLVPGAAGSSLEMRVECLHRALAGGFTGNNSRSVPNPWRIAVVVALSLALYGTAFITLLPAIHEALELLVR
jgi:Zn-dependent protease with chaperone function